MNGTMGEWLKANDLAEFEAIFAENQVDMKTLEFLTDADLKELGLPFGPRKRMLGAIAQWKQQVAHSQAEAEPPAGATALGERRQLTVMFCDMVGSTALSTLLDPEELRELIQAYRKVCCEVVERYDGHVAQYMGDGLMIYFGWPKAHEDAAERGVRAALDIVQAVKTLGGARPFGVRLGLATGTVVVSEALRYDASGAKTALGEAPNLAARLQGVAGPGEVVIAPTTRLLLADAFSLTDLGEHTIKGIAQPVRVWRVDEARTEARFKLARGGSDLAPLLGRDEESMLLGQCWERARAGEGQVVLIGGQPGIGKSRLTEGLRESIAGQSHASLNCQCSPFHLNSPLHPFIEQFEVSAGFARDDTPEVQLQKMEAALMDATPHGEESASLFAALLSLPIDRYAPLQLSPRKQKEKTLEALVGRVETLSRKYPVLMVVEDVHWIDPTSQELLEILVQKLHELPVLLVITYRLEYEPAWADQPGVTTLTLVRLGRNEGARLVGTLTKGRTLPPEVLDEILTRTDGVPLFVEELTKSVLESGLLREEGDHYALRAPLAYLAIPVSLRDSLMARLDRLGPVKEFAQIGACIGREFSYELLKRIQTSRAGSLEASLEKLVEVGLVTRRESAPDVIYTFKHALIQDAAYDSLLKSRRVELHARIAQVLESDFSEDVNNEPAWLAHHHTQAGNLSIAIPLWRKAGALAFGRVALKEAVAHFQKGLSLIDQMPNSGDRDRLELTIREPLNAAWTGLRGWAALEVGENAAAILRLAEYQGRAQSVLLAMWWVWTSTITQGRIADSRQWVERLLAEGDATGDIDFQIFGHVTSMVQHMLNGRLAESREETDRALAMWDPRRAGRWIGLMGHDLRSFVEVYACQLLWVMGYPEQARRLSDESVAHARTDGPAFNLVWALTFSAYVFAYRREPERFLERVDEADRLARDQGLAFIYEVSVPQARGIAALHGGRPREAISLLRQGIDRWTKTGGNVRVPLLKSALAEAVALDGDPDEALELIDECLEQIERPSGQECLWLAEVLRRKGAILMGQGRDEEAEIELRASIDCARRQQAKSWELRSATFLATLMARSGRRDAARDLLAPVCAWFTEGADTKDLIEARALLEELFS
jgi:class 3 adenylate cyclase/tetratricopeptide (TPR) repeat protein